MKPSNAEALWALDTVNEMADLGLIENTVERRAYMLGSLLNILAQGTPTRRAETTGSVGEADGGPVGNADAPRED